MSEIVVSKISGLSNVVVGNSTVNVAFTSTGMTASNSSSNTVISPTGISINGTAVSPTPNFRNKIINGSFDIWQRGTSNASIGTSQYLADRWVTDRAGSTGNISRQAFTLGQTDVPGEPLYFHRSIVTSSAGASNYLTLSQRIESVRTLAGKNAVLTFWAKADNIKNIAVETLQSFGTGGSPSATVTGINTTTCGLTTSWQKFVIPISVPSIAGKTLGSNGNDYLGIYFWFDAGSTYTARTNNLGQQSGTFDIAQVQLEEGTIATPFEQRPLVLEMSLCQRYYYKSSSQEIIWWNWGSAAVQYGGQVRHPVEMRATPSVVIHSSSNNENCGATTVGNYNSQYMDLRATVTASGTAVMCAQWSADAEL